MARRLRHICAQVSADLPANTDVVLRANPSVATADSADLLRQLRSGLRKLGLSSDPAPTRDRTPAASAT
ncbi:hypothetical protein GCM10011591_28070 [Nocardia camponoti]|uniref:Uncharacterized protein n=1 Tax=Nocardia camponoti TaxID=1616106 RepID=A0A917QKE3_9NOCA|nr:hypothetical protein GCM10011591_28070 [Nocardia camponoti]